ncbi:hypothetical protein F4805DRAFT_463928 [Annulohypoxylon moriforme]|nr:hypothetical protein F4805DRAFT_463928 [Annulohypoxylon moriforme]
MDTPTVTFRDIICYAALQIFDVLWWLPRFFGLIKHTTLIVDATNENGPFREKITITHDLGRDPGVSVCRGGEGIPHTDTRGLYINDHEVLDHNHIITNIDIDTLGPSLGDYFRFFVSCGLLGFALASALSGCGFIWNLWF